jgi:hypothetical protein
MRHFLATLVLGTVSLPFGIMAQTAPAPAATNPPAATTTARSSKKVAARRHHVKKAKKAPKTA